MLPRSHAPHRRPPARALTTLAVALLAIVAATPTPTAGAVVAPRVDPVGANGRPAPHIDPLLDRVPVVGAGFVQARAGYDQATAQLAADVRAHSAAVQRLATLEALATRLQVAIVRDTAIAQRASRHIARLRKRLRALAIEAYTGVGGDDTEAAAVSNYDLGSLTRAETKTSLRQEVTQDSATQLGTQLRILGRADDRLARNRARLADTRAAIDATTRARDDAATAIVSDTARRAVAKADLLAARAISDVRGTNLPLVALDAYRHAADLANLTSPGCGISWTLLAGIGAIESDQGTYSGGSLDALGHVSVPIYGPMLDGTHGNKHIPDTDGGALDGTTKGDRAVGPMQFIPSTWRAVATDGDGDGTADPENLYDAAATAAHYLCRAGPGLDTSGGRARAIRSYNDSGEYVTEVGFAADRYAIEVVLPRPAPARVTPAAEHTTPP
jgi:membrane-bound lytic murein transglycosylase B